MRRVGGGSGGFGGAMSLAFNKVYMSQNFKKYYQIAYLWIFLACIAVLPMSGTIALRNIFLVLMLCLFLYGNIFVLDIRKNTFETLKKVPTSLSLWIAYLCVFPLWAPMPEIAWENLRGQWGESIVAWTVGLGAFVLLGQRSPGIWKLAMASAFPLYVHLFLALLAYIGVFSDNFYQSIENRSLDGLYAEINNWIHGGLAGLNPHHPLDEGFKGVEVMHGNLGYTSSVAVALLTAKLFGSNRETGIRAALLCVVAIGLCFLSLLIARSRGAMIFNALILCAGIIWSGSAGIARKRAITSIPGKHIRFNFRAVVVSFMVFMLFGIGALGLKTDPRWTGMADRIAAGFLIKNPLETLCAGLSVDEEALIRGRLSNYAPNYVDEVISHLRDGDGGRVVLMREGAQLVRENPLGLDGSRQSYERLMQKKCQARPVLDYSHSHNSWLDMSLAIGYLGVALFAAIFIHFCVIAWSNFSIKTDGSVAMALGLISIFWFFRGFFDSLYREHYLEMQAILLIYLYLVLRKSISETVE